MFTFSLLNVESNMTQVYFDKLILDCLETKFSVLGPNWYNMIREEVRNMKLCSSTSRRLDIKQKVKNQQNQSKFLKR